MTLSKRIKRIGLALACALALVELGSAFSLPGFEGVATPAYAIVGRPLTPVSVAGVARRSVRRCAVGVYYC